MVLIAYLWKAFLVTTAVVSALPAGGECFPKLLDATVGELTAGLDKGDFSSVDLVNVSWGKTVSSDRLADLLEAYIARILEVNGTLHMVTELNPDAVKIAQELDAERKAGNCRGYVLPSSDAATHSKLILL